MANDYVRERAEQLTKNCLLGGVGLALLGAVVLGVALGANDVNAWLVLAGSGAVAVGHALALVGLVAWGVKLGNESTAKPKT